MPSLSVCIPSYNREAFIRLAVRSVLSQAEYCDEVIVVDDGSTDKTVEIVESLAHPKLRLVRKEHSGAPLTRNRLIEESKGDYILWHDSDDILPADTLKLYSEEIAKPDPYEVLHGNALFIDKDNRVFYQRFYTSFNDNPALLMRTLASENPISNNSTVVARRIYEKFGPYNPEFKRAHDYELWVRIVPEARFWHVGKMVSGYRLHGEGNLSGDMRGRDTSYEARAITVFLQRHPLRHIFGDLDWTNPPAAEAAAHFFMAQTYLRWNSPEQAHVHALKSVECAPLQEIVPVMVEALIQTGRSREAYDLLAKNDVHCQRNSSVRSIYSLLKDRYGVASA